MHHRFEATATAREAIERGDTVSARAAAHTITLLEEPDILPEWQPFVSGVRTSAADVAVATDAFSAARSFATLGERCADCHIATRTRVDPVVVGSSATALPSGSQMQTHHWASSRLWDGLVAASDKTWLVGAEALESAPLTIVAEGEVPGHELGVAENVAHIRLLARRAQTARSNHERAEIYGDVLSTCVTCHHAIRDR
jgi:hypothetical protein